MSAVRAPEYEGTAGGVKPPELVRRKICLLSDEPGRVAGTPARSCPFDCTLTRALVFRRIALGAFLADDTKAGGAAGGGLTGTGGNLNRLFGLRLGTLRKLYLLLAFTIGVPKPGTPRRCAGTAVFPAPRFLGEPRVRLCLGKNP